MKSSSSQLALVFILLCRSQSSTFVISSFSDFSLWNSIRLSTNFSTWRSVLCPPPIPPISLPIYLCRCFLPHQSPSRECCSFALNGPACLNLSWHICKTGFIFPLQPLLTDQATVCFQGHHWKIEWGLGWPWFTSPDTSCQLLDYMSFSLSRTSFFSRSPHPSNGFRLPLLIVGNYDCCFIVDLTRFLSRFTFVRHFLFVWNKYVTHCAIIVILW